MIGKTMAVTFVAIAALAGLSLALVSGLDGSLSSEVRLSEIQKAAIVNPQEPAECQSSKNSVRPNPRYIGMFKYVAEEGGYALWLPAGWTQYDMPAGQQGAIFRPCSKDPRTYFSAQMHRLERSVSDGDVAALREGFQRYLMALPGIKIESQDETVSAGITFFEARFTYLDGNARRKSWLRVAYLGEGQLTLVAHGSTPDEFEYWLPMFFNTMMTIEL
jgi:hypothetical protein